MTRLAETADRIGPRRRRYRSPFVRTRTPGTRRIGGARFRRGQAERRPDVLREAVEWCRKAAAGGDADAVQMLKHLQPP